MHNIRASFCPLLSLEKGEYIVTGSEDANVYFYDLTRPKHTCVNKLQGHGYAVIGIAWNHGENLLASYILVGPLLYGREQKQIKSVIFRGRLLLRCLTILSIKFPCYIYGRQGTKL